MANEVRREQVSHFGVAVGVRLRGRTLGELEGGRRNEGSADERNQKGLCGLHDDSLWELGS